MSQSRGNQDPAGAAGSRPRLSRRAVLRGGVTAAVALALRHGQAEATGPAPSGYRRFEDLYRRKWTWERVVRGTHGTNCAGTCAFNVYIKHGIVWREEQQGEYASSGDAPDYGPRGCQKGLRHAKYMYGPQRVLYPMKRVGARGAGQWERISWDQAVTEIADRFLDHVEDHGPQCISFGSGTQMSVKVASRLALARFANITGVTVPEFYSGVGDLPSGVYMTLGQVYTGDTMAAVFKARCVLIWMANPACTRIPDAHFFWEARYNGTQVIAISPEFTPTAMHCNYWLNPRPGTDTALALAMVHVILEERRYAADYIREQTDLPFLVRVDNGLYLRETDISLVATLAVADNVFYVWDEAAGGPVRAPGTGLADPPIGRDRRKFASLELGAIRPALEGRWTVEGRAGPIEVTTVFELLKQRAAAHAPERVADITGLHPNAIRQTARLFAAARPAMIYAGYAACKWLHGDMLQRSMLLLLSLTGNIGPEGSGLQIGNGARGRGLGAFATADVGPATRMIPGTMWDYDHGRMVDLNRRLYGETLADEFDGYYRQSIREDWFPSYSDGGWKMGIFAGNNGANWRASGRQWREAGFAQLETIVALVPDMGVTAHHADYVLPIAHHYERADIMLQSRIPYLQVLDVAVPPLGESVDDWTAIERLAAAISRRARKRDFAVVQDEVDGRSVRRDYRRCHELYTMGGRVRDTRDVIQFIINTTPGLPRLSFAECAARGVVRVAGSETTAWEAGASPYHGEALDGYRLKRPYETLTGRQQFYIDHEWFMKYDEALPGHREPLRFEGYPLQFMMGHARHGIHSMWRDDPLLLGLQRGEPDIYVNPDDAAARGVVDGDRIRVFNPAGEFAALAHVSAAIQPGMLFMYHGWDPMAFHGRQNFSEVICTAGLIKPTSMAGDYGHLGYQPLAFAPNQTYKDFTCDFERVREA